MAVRNKNPFAWNGILGEYDRGVTDGHEKLVKVDTLIIHSGFNQVGDQDDGRPHRRLPWQTTKMTDDLTVACPEKRVLETIDKAEVRPEEQSEKAESCRGNL